MNKKGIEAAPSTLMAFLLVLLLGFGLLLAYGRVARGGTVVMSCNASGGECVDGTCDWGSQIALLSDKAAGCQNGQICCKNISISGKSVSPECKDKKDGTQCDTDGLMFCDAGSQCVSKCEFCAKNFNTDFGRDICAKNEKINFQTHSKDINKYTCGCTGTQCTTARRNNGTCIPNYCPSGTDTDSNYMCCIQWT